MRILNKARAIVRLYIFLWLNPNLRFLWDLKESVGIKKKYITSICVWWWGGAWVGGTSAANDIDF